MASTNSEGENLLIVDGIKKDPSRGGLHDLPCLELKIDNNNLFIKGLSAAYKLCPGPVAWSGTFLLEFTEHLAKALAISKISLKDGSIVRCDLDRKSTSLGLLKIFKDGVSWYGSHGYFFEGKAQDKLAAKSFRERSLNDLMPQIKSLLAPNEIEIMVSNLAQFNEEKNIGNFFWLWVNNYSSYNILIDLLFPSDKNNEVLNKLVPNYLIKREFLIKNLN